MLEPILEVDDEVKGSEVISWLSDNPLVIRQLLEAANDNLGILTYC
jgi:hypothetical protein